MISMAFNVGFHEIYSESLTPSLQRFHPLFILVFFKCLKCINSCRILQFLNELDETLYMVLQNDTILCDGWKFLLSDLLSLDSFVICSVTFKQLFLDCSSKSFPLCRCNRLEISEQFLLLTVLCSTTLMYFFLLGIFLITFYEPWGPYNIFRLMISSP